MRLDAEYVLPLRWTVQVSQRESPALGRYLAWLSAFMHVTVVDGSEDAVYAGHHQLWSNVGAAGVRHLRPEPWPGRNGKVAGVVTGIRASRHERVIVADDDVRYDRDGLVAVLSALDEADVVRPQSVFSGSRWHTRWDTGRSLVNRAFGHDFPGTHGVRRSLFMEMGGYDGDVLFENLELARSASAVGGTVLDLPGTFVRRLPPTTSHFWSQRIRQAYDDLAQPWRLVAELALLPGLLVTRSRVPKALGGWAFAAVVVAELGRRRGGGNAVYPATAAMWALPWVLERSVCIWLALGQRARGGARYGGTRVSRAATSPRVLRHTTRTPLEG